MDEYLMNDETFNSMIENCREEIAEGDYSEEGRKIWNKEIDFILSSENKGEKWARLIHSNIFLYTYGEFKKVEDNKLFVRSVNYGKGKPNSYFPIFK